ncbi:Hypothetical predicted protein, partial [Pelobates cultripes]
TKRLLTQTDKTPCTIPKGTILDHNGPQACGLRAPALTQLQGREGIPPPRHHGSTQLRRNPSVNPKPGKKLTTGGRWVHSSKAIIL